MTYSPPGHNAPDNPSATHREARRDVRLSYRPQRRAFRRAGRQIRNEARQGRAQVQNIYGDLGGLLQGISDQYASQTAGIPGALTGALTQLGGVFNQSLGQAPESERTAAMALTGDTGAAGLGQLASMQMRNAGYGASAQRQGAEDQATLLRNQLTDRQNALGELGQQRLDMFSSMPQEIRQREDQLQQMALDRRLSLAQLAMSQGQYGMQQQSFQTQQAYDNAMNAFMQDLLNDPAAMREFLGITGGS